MKIQYVDSFDKNEFGEKDLELLEKVVGSLDPKMISAIGYMVDEWEKGNTWMTMNVDIRLMPADRNHIEGDIVLQIYGINNVVVWLTSYLKPKDGVSSVIIGTVVGEK